MIAQAVTHFRAHNCDAVIIYCNAPHRSAFNRVERRMSSLSRQLSGVILKHDHFGSHLDNSGRTTDVELEIKNFEHAGETLAEIWNELCIDDFPVIADFIKSDVDNPEPGDNDPEWYARHARESQYLFQVRFFS